MKKTLLICTPYLSNIGGTEIEALSTAVILWDKKAFNKICIFSPQKIDPVIVQKFIGNREINCFTYPKFFKLKAMFFFNRVFIKVGFKFVLSEYLYWKYKCMKIQFFYILTYPKSVYYIPIIKNASKNKKFIARITMLHFNKVPNDHIAYFKKFDNIMVFNELQKNFWENKYSLQNLIAIDTVIPNETNLLKVEPIYFDNFKNFRLGYLGRISKEKNIEDIIFLLSYLNNIKKFDCKLYIQGKGEKKYENKIIALVKKLNLEKAIRFNNNYLDPMDTHEFYKKIQIFLVTSIHEGGPMTGLEAAAAGRMILSYNVGAMEKRFSKIPHLLNANFDELCISALKFLSLSRKEKEIITQNIRDLYITELRNKDKAIKFLNILNQ